MNEGLMIYLNMDERKFEENEALIERIDRLLSDCGIKYTGFRNMYEAKDVKDRDDAVFTACHVLRQTDWLKGQIENTFIIDRVSTCPMDQIRIDRMAEPSAEKLEYYEKYFLENKALAHEIIIDEHGQLRDGYISYLIAKKYGHSPKIYEALTGQPLKKVVKGQHIFWDGHTWKVKSDKIYVWNYSLKNPVVPGDILEVQAKKGKALMCVRKIAYVTGKKFCKEHREVIKHMDGKFYEK